MSHIEEGTLHAYLDGECRPHEREAVEGHLAVCEECRARLTEAESTAGRATGLLAHLEPGAVHGPSWREIEGRAAARGRESARRRRWLGPGIGWAASIALAFGLGWVAHSQGVFEAPAARVATQNRGAATDLVGQRTESPPEGEEVRAVRIEEGPLQDADVGAAAGTLDEVAEREAARFREGAEASRPAPETGRAAAAAGDRALGQEPAPAEERADRLADAAAAEPEALRVPATVAKSEKPLNERGRPTEIDSVEAETENHLREAVIREARRIAAERDTRVSAITESELPAALKTRAAAELQAPPSLVDGGESIVADGRFLPVPIEQATHWLGAPLRTLPAFELQRAEVGPGTAVAGGVAGRPAIRLVYRDAAGREIVLIQQIANLVTRVPEDPVLVVTPSGRKAYRWFDGPGYWLTLTADLPQDSLRALIDQVE